MSGERACARQSPAPFFFGEEAVPDACRRARRASRKDSSLEVGLGEIGGVALESKVNGSVV
jgi:hypothetical protein